MTRPYLESQIIGDPTFHFKGDNPNAMDMPYKKLLRSKIVSLRVLGVYKMTKELGLKAEEKLIKIYNEDPSRNVRLQALKSLASLRTPAFRKLLEKSLYDPSELIRRITANWMGHIGDKGFIPLLKIFLNAYHSQRNRHWNCFSHILVPMIFFWRSPRTPAWTRQGSTINTDVLKNGCTMRSCRPSQIPA